MSALAEFSYRLGRRGRGWQSGSHAGTTLGVGQEFVSHMPLHDWPDPRRVDLKASIRSLSDEWLVRVSRQRVGVSVYALVDVSASMKFGASRSKLDVAADFVESLGHSAFHAGDKLGMLGFDAKAREDLFLPAMSTRGAGELMSTMLRAARVAPGGIEGLEDAIPHLAARPSLVFLVSDFHWSLERLGHALDLLTPALVVPIVIWDQAEVEPPARSALAFLSDVETNVRRTVWLRASYRQRWRDAVLQRRYELNQLFATHGTRPFFVTGQFDAEAMSKYFLEATV